MQWTTLAVVAAAVVALWAWYRQKQRRVSPYRRTSGRPVYLSAPKTNKRTPFFGRDIYLTPLS